MTRFGYVITTSFAVMAIGGMSVAHVAPRLVWNATASTPIGLYSVRPTERLEVTDLVAVAAPERVASLLADGGFLPRGVPLLKHVAAVAGQRVCRIGRTITVDGVEQGEALERDRLGRSLPVWQGCRRIAPGEVFLMNWDVRDSLDGRYFGPIETSSIIGRASPLWTDEDGTGRYEWRAPTH